MNLDSLFTAAFVAIILTALICITAIWLTNANAFWAIIAVPVVIKILIQKTQDDENQS